MPKYLIDMPEGWKPSISGVGFLKNCPIRQCGGPCGSCPIANVVEAVEIPSLCDDIKIVDMRIDGSEVQLYGVIKEANNGK